MRKRTKELRVRIDKDIHADLKRIAKQEGRSISELVREAIAWLLRDRDLVAQIRDVTAENASLSGQRMAMMRGHIASGDIDLRKDRKERENGTVEGNQEGNGC